MVDLEIIEDIYYTLQGVMAPEARVPWVKDLFQEGSPCDRAYAQMVDAYDRLRERLGMPDEDEDVEIIIDSLMDIQRILAFEMFAVAWNTPGGKTMENSKASAIRQRLS